MTTAATEFRVNTSTLFNQGQPVTATLTGGATVVVWGDTEGGAQGSLRFQLFDTQGQRVGGQMTVTADAYAYAPSSVARLDDGGFVVSWVGTDGDIHFQRVSSTGGLMGGETQANPDSGPAAAQSNQAVTGLNDGGWLVAWKTDIDQAGYESISSQRYDASGAPVGSTLIVESLPVVMDTAVTTSLLSGGYVVVWDKGGEIVQRRYDAGGQAVGGGAPQPISTEGGNPPHVAALADGGWLVLYLGSHNTLYTQRFDSSGLAVGGAAAIAQEGNSSYFQAATATGLANGGYLLTWPTAGAAPYEADIHAQRFDAGGVRVGDEFLVNTVTDDSQNMPSVTALQGGGFMITWESMLEDGSGTGVYATRYDANGVAQSNAGWLDGGGGNDVVQWDGTQDARLFGSGGNDTLIGGTGNDIIDGGSGNDRLYVVSGNDSLNGGMGVDTAVFGTAASGITGYSADSQGSLTATTSNGTFMVSQVERAQFTNGLFALDTHAGGNTWWAASLYHLAFGALPGMEDLSRMTAQLDQLGTPAALAQAMLDTYAPGISNHDLVVLMYQLVVHATPPDAFVQAYEEQIGPWTPQPGRPGPGPWFASQAEFVEYAAQHPLHEEALVGFTGSVQQLDPAYF
ncbi:MAG: uncharacterized protein JWQ07_551 [Ramlibacter sp.]|nr:uncharacterized protein [Ramlibacter sp.]